MNQTISIVVHTYGRAAYLKDMIRSLRDTAPKGYYEIIVVSSDPPETEKVQWLQREKDLILILADVRREWQMRKQSAYRYINLGIKKSSCDWILVVNDDMEFDVNWYKEFSNLVTNPANTNIGMIIASMHLGKVKYGQRLVKIGRTKKPHRDWKDLYLADFAILSREVAQKIGGYDEKMDWAGGGADLALAVEFLTDKDTILSEGIRIDHHIAQENRSTNIIDDFTDFHYVLRKWNKWCIENNCQYEWNIRLKPYTIKNRVINYVVRRLRVAKYYLKYIKRIELARLTKFKAK